MKKINNFQYIVVLSIILVCVFFIGKSCKKHDLSGDRIKKEHALSSRKSIISYSQNEVSFDKRLVSPVTNMRDWTSGVVFH